MIAPFGNTQSGETVHRITLRSDALDVSVLTLGAILHDVRLNGVDHSLTIGFDELAPYEGAHFHVGSIVGPVANRISNARAAIVGVTHQFEANTPGGHTLHSGSTGLQHLVWKIEEHNPHSTTLSAHLPDGTGGFPGNRHIAARFTVADATLKLEIAAETDRLSPISPTNHSYWNLGPHPTTDGHILAVSAECTTPLDPEILLPTGAVSDVAGTRFDFRTSRTIEAGAEGLLDLNLCLSNTPRALTPVAQLDGPTGITMKLATTAPGLQVFDGHILGDAPATLLDGRQLQAYGGLALETQYWPDAMANPDFPTILLAPGMKWQQETLWSFTRA